MQPPSCIRHITLLIVVAAFSGPFVDVCDFGMFVVRINVYYHCIIIVVGDIGHSVKLFIVNWQLVCMS